MSAFKHDLFARVPESVGELRRAVIVKQRVEELQAAAIILAQTSDPAIAGVGARLLAWLHKGGDLARVLGVRGERGRHRVKPSSR